MKRKFFEDKDVIDIVFDEDANDESMDVGKFDIYWTKTLKKIKVLGKMQKDKDTQGMKEYKSEQKDFMAKQKERREGK